MNCADSLASMPTDCGRLQWKDIEEEDDNMLVKMRRPRLQQEFIEYLESRTSVIQNVVSHHLSLSPHQQCTVADRSEWMNGDFNVCIPISISRWRPQRLLVRCPFPHMLGSRANDSFSGGLDEKVRCEAATFAWISQNCAKVPIPRLWGFGVPSGLNFTPVADLPWYVRAIECMKNFLNQFWDPQRWKPFVARHSQSSLKSGYLLVDFIEAAQGTRLSKVWPSRTVKQQRTLYRSLSTVMLNLASRPLNRIGSFTVDNSGAVSLSNRPLTARIPLLESEGIPTDMPRDHCYSTSDSYIRDLLRCHDLKLRHQPNAVRDKYDAEAQMALLTIMRAIPSHFTLEPLREGPFVYTWTDDHASNIFVDSQYNITCLPDLDWFCAMPMDMHRPPFWLSGHAIDELGGENKGSYDTVCKEFLQVFEGEDSQPASLGSGFHTKVMRDALRRNAHWFWASLNNPRITYNLFLDHLQPRLAPAHLEQEASIQFQCTLAPYWTEDASAFIDQKLRDREHYLKQLRLAHRR